MDSPEFPPVLTSDPDFSLPEPEGERNRIGWIVLAVLFTSLVLLQVYSYVGKASKGDLAVQELDKKLRDTVSMEVIDKLQPDQKSTEILFDDYVGELAPKRKDDLVSAAYYVVFRYEQGKKIESSDLAFLRTSKKFASLADIYAADNLTIPQVEAIRKKLGEKSALKQLALVHAYAKAGDEKAREEFFPSSKSLLRIVGIAVVTLGLLLGTALMVVYSIARAGGKVTPLGSPAGNLSCSNADRYAIKAAQFLAVYILSGIFFALIKTSPAIEYFLLALTSIATTVILSNLPVAGRKFGLRQLGYSTQDLGTNVLWGIAGAIVVQPVVLSLALISQRLFSGLPEAEHPVTSDLLNSHNPLVLMAVLFMSSVAAPFFEETLFRGLIFPAISKVARSQWVGIVASSFLFAAIHPYGVAGYLPLMGMAAVSCFLSVQTRSLIPSVVMHGLYNLLVFTRLLG